MAKIDGSTQGQFRSPVSQKSKKKKASSQIPGAFLGRFMSGHSSKVDAPEISSITTEEELMSVIDSIHRLGENLLKNPNLDSFARYKQAIRDFIAHVTHNAYVTEEHLSRKNILNQKKYVIIQVIDEKLDTLSQSVLASQKRQIDMLSSIEEIQGLLIDIFHVS